MKILRYILMVLAAPALTLLGVHELGGTPISKGFDTGFEWLVDTTSNRLVVTADAEGDMMCWLRLQMPAAGPTFTVETSAGTHLTIHELGLQGAAKWVSIVGDGQSPEAPFNWPAGASLFLNPSGGRTASPLSVLDWYVYPNNKTFDSRSRAKWRARLFDLSILLLGLAVVGGFLEALDRLDKKEDAREAFSAEYCLRQLIDRVEGDSPEHSEQMRVILQKVMIEGADLRDAVEPLPLSPVGKIQVGFKALNSLHATLGRLVIDLGKHLDTLRQKLIRR